MTGGAVVILGKVGDNFAAGMTGGMAFIYDPLSDFEKYINSDSVVWQKIETEYWIKYVKSLIQEHYSETNSELSKKIIDNFKNEILNFVQVCPKEMIDKLENPITLKPTIKEAS
jgi:glutamate synthase (NADPH/NADH) large chain